MDFNKEFEISLLNDFYKNLLTDKQKLIIEEYINSDNSLGEIAENLQISRQAVRDSLVKSEKQLKKYEEELRLLHKFNLQKEIVGKLIEKYGEDSLFSELLKSWEV